MSTKPSIVLIGGGRHRPATYAALTSALEAAGLEIHCPELPSTNGARPPTADLSTDTAHVRNYVSQLLDGGKDVVAVMHSYGGQVGTNALAGLDGRKGSIKRLVYMCAFALFEGGSMISKVQEFGHEELMPVVFNFADDESVLCRDPAATLLGPGLEEKEVEEYLRTLVVWNGKCMYQGIERCAWREVPVTYIYTARDMTVPLDYQKDMVEKIKAEGVEVDTVELEAGHCPNVTMTKEVVEVIESVASK
ncbi:hypothetical protein ANO11243_016330 [Dothideomycetidae sp. 11243]|nr:hypothetical protein ANO11243_016330 [fungal sp. No.11243]